MDHKSLTAAELDRRLRPFWAGDRILRWPARENRLRLVLAEVARLFNPGKRMLEGDVDAALRQVWPDYCQLRRALVDYGLLNRKNGIYWRIG